MLDVFFDRVIFVFEHITHSDYLHNCFYEMIDCLNICNF